MDKSRSIKNGFGPFVPYGYIDISSKIKKGDEKTNEDSTSDGGLIELEGAPIGPSMRLCWSSIPLRRVRNRVRTNTSDTGSTEFRP